MKRILQVRIDSRYQFVKQVASLLLDETASDENEAFVLGISGKWGEGKSTFLRDLAKELGDTPVIWLNPWKYAKDDLSFLRQLLTKLAKKATLKPWERAKLNKSLDRLYYSTDLNTISLGWLIRVLLLSTVAYAIYRNWPWFHDLVQHNKPLATVALVPVILAAFNALTVRKRTSKSIDTLDKFDELLQEMLPHLPGNKVVIYVDDLDRLTAERAIQVLDNLRTFFDNPRLSFVVAGDHTVLEAHLGRVLRPGDQPYEQLEEGRRFMKKIFNLYWRLPIPTQTEVEQFLEEILSKNDVRGAQLRNFFKPKEIKNLKTKLDSLYENNFRQILRFVDRLIFTLNVLDTQLNNKKLEQQKKEYLQDIKDNPLLLVRILLLEDLANALFEKILGNSRILVELEEATFKNSGVDISTYNKYLTARQQTKTVQIFNSEPMFFGENGLKVKNILPFIHLSSDPSFGDLRGLSPSDFTEIIAENDVERAKSAVLESGQPKLSEAISFLMTHENSSSTTVWATNLTSLLNIAKQLNDATTPLHQLIYEGLKTLNFAHLNELTADQRVDFYSAFSEWLDSVGIYSHYETDFNEIFNNLMSTIQTGDFPTFQQKATTYATHNLPLSLSRILMRWFIAQYRADFNTALSSYLPVTAYLDEGAIGQEVDDEFIKFVVQSSLTSNPSFRNLGAELLSLFRHKYSLIISELTEYVGQLNHFAWDVADWFNSTGRGPLMARENLANTLIGDILFKLR
jgi:hypothetical protein